jgi:hypothetical protein
MKTIHRTTIAFSLYLVVLFLIVGTATAGYAYPEHSVTDARLKHVISTAFLQPFQVSPTTPRPECLPKTTRERFILSLSMTGCLRSGVYPALLCSLRLTIHTVLIFSAIKRKGMLRCSEAVSLNQIMFSQ